MCVLIVDIRLVTITLMLGVKRSFFRTLICVTLLSFVMFAQPKDEYSLDRGFYMMETFENDSFNTNWIYSKATTPSDDSETPAYTGRFRVDKETNYSDNLALLMETREGAHKYGAFRRLSSVFEFKDTFLFQYELSFMETPKCGGAYLKLISKGALLPSNNGLDMHDETPYTIMFGPDQCYGKHQFHFIFRHKNPLTGKYEEKHMKQPNPSLYQHIFTDKNVHLLRLTTYKRGQRFVVELDNTILAQDSLFDGFEPPVNPPEMVVDDSDTKPADWDDRELIDDPDDLKPDDWDETLPMEIPDPKSKPPADWLEDEPLMVPDPTSAKPHSWDDELDGEWQAGLMPNPKCVNGNCGTWTPPMIENPAYKGPFKPKRIRNPNYKGEFTPRMVKNPNYFLDNNPFEMTPIEAVAIEVLSLPGSVTLDNIIVTDNAEALYLFSEKHWKLKNPFHLIHIAIGVTTTIILLFGVWISRKMLAPKSLNVTPQEHVSGSSGADQGTESADVADDVSDQDEPNNSKRNTRSGSRALHD